MDLGDFFLLRGPDGRRALAAAATLVADRDPLRAATALRRQGYDAKLASAALSEARLRERAGAKFPAEAAVMYFTSAGLEQATRTVVARHRAARLAAALPGGEVADLCCGIGGDLIALARAGLRVTGFDRDELTAAVAAENLRALDLPGSVVCRDVTEVPLGAYDAVFLDPSRRSGGRRVFDPRSYSPPWSYVLAVMGRAARGVVKVAPGIGHEALPTGVEAEWVSAGGEVKEAALWFGDLACVRRRATVLPAGATLAADAAGATPEVGPVRRWLYDPDGAVVRAHLVAELAGMLHGTLLDPTIAYVTSDTLIATPFARAYEVLDVLPFGVKRLRAALRARDVGVLTVKKRGSAVEPETLRRQLRLAGSQEAVVVLTRVAGRQTALICAPAVRTDADHPYGP